MEGLRSASILRRVSWFRFRLNHYTIFQHDEGSKELLIEEETNRKGKEELGRTKVRVINKSSKVHPKLYICFVIHVFWSQLNLHIYLNLLVMAPLYKICERLISGRKKKHFYSYLPSNQLSTTSSEHIIFTLRNLAVSNQFQRFELLLITTEKSPLHKQSLGCIGCNKNNKKPMR